MKIRILAFASLVLALGLTSCGGAEETEEGAEDELCVYSYDETSTEFGWTAYKTSAKVGVGGTFTDIVVESEDDKDPMEVIKSITFSMNTASTETNDESRNAKVVEHFFGRLNTKQIHGKVTAIDPSKGKATVMLSWHGISYDVEGDYTMSDDNKFSFNSTIDVAWWNGMAGIETLNKVCEDLHTGEDGVSKLWSEVDVSFSTTLSSDCD